MGARCKESKYDLKHLPPFFLIFYLTAQARGQNPRKYGQAIELQRKKISANNNAIISYSLKEYKFLFYR